MFIRELGNLIFSLGSIWTILLNFMKVKDIVVIIFVV